MINIDNVKIPAELFGGYFYLLYLCNNVQSVKTNIMKKLILDRDTFFNKLSDLISSGVTFEAEEKDNKIIIIFTGGY